MIRPVPQRDTTREWIAAPALVLRTSGAERSGGHLDIWRERDFLAKIHKSIIKKQSVTLDCFRQSQKAFLSYV